MDDVGVHRRRRLTLAVLVLALVQTAGGVGAAVARPQRRGPARVVLSAPARTAASLPLAPAPRTTRAPGQLSAVPAVLRADLPLNAGRIREVAQHAEPIALVLDGTPLPDSVLQAVGALPGARVAVLNTATLRIAGHPYTTVATDPATLRDFSPAPTAASNPLWASLSAGDTVETYEGKAAHTGSLGGRVDATQVQRIVRLRIGARAGFGLIGADLVVSPARGRQIGLVAHTGLLVALVGSGDPVALAAQVQRLVRTAGAGSVPLGRAAAAAPIAPSSGTGTGSTGGAASGASSTQDGGSYAGGGSYLELYQHAATTCRGLPWQVVAAIGQIESDHGRNDGPSAAGAVGPMQFLPSTFNAVAVDGDHDGKVNPYDPYDAVYTAARLLCQDGAGSSAGRYGAVFSYNHADWYVREVLALARDYR